MAQDALDDLHQLRSTAGEPAMAGGEANMAANTGMAIPAIPIETKYTQMIYKRS